MRYKNQSIGVDWNCWNSPHVSNQIKLKEVFKTNMAHWLWLSDFIYGKFVNVLHCTRFSTHYSFDKILDERERESKREQYTSRSEISIISSIPCQLVPDSISNRNEVISRRREKLLNFQMKFNRNAISRAV